MYTACGFNNSNIEIHHIHMNNLNRISVLHGASLVAQMVKNQPANAEIMGSIPGLGRSPGEGNGNPLQYSYLENPMDRGTWQTVVHGVTKSWTLLSN